MAGGEEQAVVEALEMDKATSALPNQRVALGIRRIDMQYPNGVHALKSVDLDVAEGEFVTLLGPSGSGKSTLLMIIAGFVNQSAGRVWARGADITTIPPERRNFGVVFQNYALFPHLTAYQNVAYPLAARGVRGAEQHRLVNEALAMVDLEGLNHRRPAELSGGQQQRVALARALVYKPSVLLLDEPLAALDRSLRERMQIELRALNRRIGVTFLYVTHDQDEALTMSDRVVILRNGAIEQVGTPQDVYERPTTGFVARFIGRANIFVAHVLKSDEGSVSVQLAGNVATMPHAGRFTGSKATIVVHPEKVRISSAARQHAPDEVVLEGRLQQEIFAGRTWRYLVTAAGTQVEAQVLERARAKQGETVQISWRSVDAWAIPDDGEADSALVTETGASNKPGALNQALEEGVG